MNFGGQNNLQQQMFQEAVQELSMRDMFKQYNALVRPDTLLCLYLRCACHCLLAGGVVTVEGFLYLILAFACRWSDASMSALQVSAARR